MKYPEECPVFEVVDMGPTIRKGAIVEGLGPLVYRITERKDDRFLGIRIADEDVTASAVLSHPNGIEYVRQVREEMGFMYTGVSRDAVRPLTRAAREMLALVRP